MAVERLLIIVLLTLLPLTRAIAAEFGENGRPAESSTFIRVEEGLVSVKLTEALLDDVLKEIGLQSRVKVILRGSSRLRISTHSRGVPLDQAFSELIKENFLLVYSSDGRLEEVKVLGPRASTAHSLPSVPAVQEPAQRVLPREGGSLHVLIGKLQSGDQEDRWRAVLALGQLEDERAREQVIWALKTDEDPAVREGAIWALERRGGPEAIAALVEVLSRDSDDFIRQSAVVALARVGGPEAVEPLSQALGADAEPFVRYEAIVNLAQIPGDHMVSAVFRALNDPHELIRAEAHRRILGGDSREH